MDRLVKYTILFLLLCSNAMSMQKKVAEDDPFALFKLPTQKATVHYLKKGGKEYLYLRGKNLRDYTVLSSNKGVSVNVLGYKIKGKENLSKKSAYVENFKTVITNDGSKVDLKLKGNPGFKIYRRPSGLVLAMGPGYKEIAQDTLEGLDSEVSGLDKELDGMLKENNVDAGKAIEPTVPGTTTTPDVATDTPLPATAETPATGTTEVPIIESQTATTTTEIPAADATAEAKSTKPDEVDSMLDDLDAEAKGTKATAAAPAPASTDNIDQDLDRIVSEANSDLAQTEQKQVETGLGKAVIVENIKLEKVSGKLQLLIQTDKTTKVQQKESKTGYNQIVLDIPNASMLQPLNNIDTNLSDGLITSITPQQLDGPYKSVRVVVQLSKNVKPEIVQRSNLTYVEFSNDAIANAIPAVKPGEVDDMEAARQFSRANFEDYLTYPTEFYGRRMSIQVSKANVIDVLNMIKEVSDINIVASEKVKGEVNVNLKNVPWDQALSVVLQSAQLGYIRQGSVIRVAPLSDLRDERKVAAEAIEAQNNLEPLHIMIARVNYVNAKEVEDKISAILSKRGKMSIDKDAKTLVVHDISDVVNKADKLLRAIDIKPMQVAIEANIVEANNSWLSSMGFAWATQSGDIAFKNISGIGNIDSIIGAASLNGEVKVVSAPKISAVDRQMASILQGTQVAYKTTGQNSNGDSIDKIEFENIEVALNVTPRITENNEVILDVNVKREFPDYTLRTSKTMPPGVGVRKASSQMLLKDGDTAVIGGLYSLDTGDSSAGVPLIKKIPIVGWFFGKEESREVRSELVIFLKATIKKEDTLTNI
ncbi:MAG: secretin and TonB N-terminal domain-containing protein [bacterium]